MLWIYGRQYGFAAFQGSTAREALGIAVVVVEVAC